jgi:hypothetical protein
MFHNVRADPKTGALLLPDDLVAESRDNCTSDVIDRQFSAILGSKWSAVMNNKFFDASGMRGGLRFRNISASDARLCAQHTRPSRTVLMTPLGDPSSMKHWAVAAFAAFSLNLHLKYNFRQPQITHILAGSTNRSTNAWVRFMLATLPQSMGADVIPGNTLNEKMTKSRDALSSR